MRKATCARYLVSATLGICVLLNPGWAQAQDDPQAQASTASAITGTIPVLLLKSIDSRKAKEGDPVFCEIAGPFHDRTGRLIKSGTKVIGHVTEAQARSKGDAQSSLAIVFDKIELGKNEEVPIKGTLQALGPALDIGVPNPAEGYAQGPGARRDGGAATTAPPQPGVQGLPIANSSPTVLLTSQSKGVLSVKNLELGDDSVLTSPGKEVKLQDGQQMMIRAQ